MMHQIVRGVLQEVPEEVLKREAEKPGTALPGWLVAREKEMDAARAKKEAKLPKAVEGEVKVRIATETKGGTN